MYDRFIDPNFYIDEYGNLVPIPEFHLLGQHDQKTHGHGSSVSGVEEIKDYNTLSQRQKDILKVAAVGAITVAIAGGALYIKYHGGTPTLAAMYPPPHVPTTEELRQRKMNMEKARVLKSAFGKKAEALKLDSVAKRLPRTPELDAVRKTIAEKGTVSDEQFETVIDALYHSDSTYIKEGNKFKKAYNTSHDISGLTKSKDINDRIDGKLINILKQEEYNADFHHDAANARYAADNLIAKTPNARNEALNELGGFNWFQGDFPEATKPAP